MTRCEIKIDLEDVRTVEHLDSTLKLFDMVKSAVTSQSGKVLDMGYSNVPEQMFNPLGNIGTLWFDIALPYEGTPSLKIQARRNEGRVYSIVTMEVT